MLNSIVCRNTFSIRFVHGWHGYFHATHMSTILFLVRTPLTYNYMFYNRRKFSRQWGIHLSSAWEGRTRRIEINSWLSSWTKEPQQPQGGLFHSIGLIKSRRNHMASLKVQRNTDGARMRVRLFGFANTEPYSPVAKFTSIRLPFSHCSSTWGVYSPDGCRYGILVCPYRWAPLG